MQIRLIIVAFNLLVIKTNSKEVFEVTAEGPMDILSSKILNSKVISGCDVFFMPRDRHECKKNEICYNKLGSDSYSQLQEFRAIAQTNFIDKQLLRESHCPFIVLPTSNNDRVIETVSMASLTHHTVSVVVITESGKTLESVHNETVKANFDVYVILELERESNLYSVTKHLVKENLAWNNVKVAMRPMPYAIMPIGRGRFTGLDWFILVETTRRAGVRFRLHFSRTYATMIKEVSTDSADMAISSASFGYDRYKTAGDVAACYDFWNVYLVTRKPQQIPAYWTLVYPFDTLSWSILGISILAVALSIFLLNYSKMIPDGFHAKRFQIFGISVVTLISEAVPQQWFDIRKHSKAGMVLLFTWIPTGLLISMSYRSTLLASLISVELEEPITTWQQVLDNKMTIQIHTGIILNEIMNKSNIPIVRQVYQECVIGRNGNYRGDVTPEMEQDRKENKAAILGKVRPDDPKYIMGVHLTSAPLGMHYIRKFPWKKAIDGVIQDFVDKAIINKINSDLDFKYGKNERDYKRTHKEETLKKLTVTHLQLTWFFILGALTACLLVLAWERVRFWLVDKVYEEEIIARKEQRKSRRRTTEAFT